MCSRALMNQSLQLQLRRILEQLETARAILQQPTMLLCLPCRLLEHGADDPEQLNKLIAPMSDEELLQVAEERSLAGKCGNPLCVKPFHWDEPRQKYR